MTNAAAIDVQSSDASQISLPSFLSEYGHFINGEWTAGSSGEKIHLLNPATNEVLTTIASGSKEDVKRAVDSAYNAFPSWSQSSPSQRQSILYEMAQRVRRRLHDYAMLDTLNHGPTITETSRFFVPLVIEQLELFSGSARSLAGRSHSSATKIGIVHREPLGVCAMITPWNAPLLLFIAKMAPALATGNTIVLKPSEVACLSVIEFLREMQDLIPPGVVNMVTGMGASIGETLVTDPRVRKISLTGSRETARKLIQYASTNIIPQTMELGGKSANIVCDDADLDAAAEGAAMCTVVNKGEFCLAGSRVFVHDKVYDKFLALFKGYLDRIRVGDPTDPKTQLGPLASRAQFKKVSGYIDIGQQEGAKLIRGGSPASVKEFANGNFFEPTIFVDVDNKMRIAQEEIFGPVSSVLRWKDEDEMIRLANQSEYGLGGGLWTEDLRRAHRISRKLETGTIWVNQYYNFMDDMPIGGYKQSGFGREFSLEVLDHYTLTKSVIINLREGRLGAFDN